MKKKFFIIFCSLAMASALSFPVRAEEMTRPIPLWPIVYYKATDGSAETDVLWPLFRYERKETWTAYKLRPLLFSTESDTAKDYRKTTILWPLSEYKRERDSNRFHIFPLYWYKKTPATGHNVFFPLYWAGNGKGYSYTHLWPLYSRQEEGTYREYGFLWPLVRFGRDPERDITLDHVLLYYHRRERDRSLTTFIPFYYSQSDANSLFTFAPLYYHRKGPGRETLSFWPLYSRHTEGTYREHGFLWPLVRFGRDPERDIALDHVLLYYHRREGAASFSTVFPVWWHREKDENRRLDATVLLHWYERDEKRDETKLSLLWLVPPRLSIFQYHREGGINRHSFFPLYSYSYDRERDAMSWSVLWLLLSYNSEGAFAQQTGFLWKVVSYERKDADTMDFRFLWRFIRRSTTKTSSNFEFNPFYYYESEEGKGSYWTILGGLFGVETTPEQKKRVRVFWVF